MARHHYYIQYHLYVVALHRYLKTRMPDYAYDDHIGGAVYLFLRGLGGPDSMPGQDGGVHGVFVDRPPREVIGRLDALFSGSAASRGANKSPPL
jgi:exodeoxyribonuclease V beta subunit